MIENINEIKYPVIVEVGDDEGNFCIYESPSSVANLIASNKTYVEDAPISNFDTICTKEFLQGKYVRVKWYTDILFLMKLGVNGGYSAQHNLLNSVVLISKIPKGVPVYILFNEKGEMLLELTPDKKYYLEEVIPFPDSIYEEQGFVSEEFLSQANRPTTEALLAGVEQDFSHPEGDCIANRVHLVCVELQLMYSYLPVTEEFIVDYSDMTFKLKTFDDIGKLRHMVTLIEELSYEE